MALNLKNPRTLTAIDELARLTGESKSDAVASAIEARLADLLAAEESARTADGTPWDRLRALTADTAARFARASLGADSLGNFTDPTVELYDDAGLPR
jgi:hypothetical protein